MGDQGPPSLPFGFDQGMAGATWTLARSWLIFGCKRLKEQEYGIGYGRRTRQGSVDIMK
jgi:hypothetical protein